MQKISTGFFSSFLLLGIFFNYLLKINAKYLIAIKRAGADAIITYGALEIADYLAT